MTPDDVLALSMDELRVEVWEMQGWHSIGIINGVEHWQKSESGRVEGCPSASWSNISNSMLKDIPDYPNDMAAAWLLHEDRCGVLQTPQKRERYLGFLDSLCRNGKGLKGAGRVEWPAALSFLTSLVITLAYVMAIMVDDCETV